MKDFLKSIFSFSIFAVGTYLLLLILWGEFLPNKFKRNLHSAERIGGFLGKRIQEAQAVKNVDILFLGSSHTYRGFDTRIFQQYNYKTFNLGSSSQTHLQTNVLLKKYLDQLNPKTIIYEVYPLVFSIDGVESSLDLMMNDQVDFETIKMGLEHKNLKVFNTLLFSIYEDAVKNNKTFTKKENSKKDQYVEGGFVENQLNFFQPPKEKLTPKELIIRKDQLQQFEENIEMIKSRGVELILVQAPVSRFEYESVSNQDYFDEMFESYGPYYNFNSMMEFGDSLFYDKHHLNQNGVAIFNQAIVENILESK